MKEEAMLAGVQFPHAVHQASHTQRPYSAPVVLLLPPPALPAHRLCWRGSG